jgi:SAM-dependent methyltransferase
VIDIGTGGGERLLELSHDAAELLGVDPDAEMIAGARQRAVEERIANVHFEVGTGEGPQRRFNVVLDRHAPFLESTVRGLLVDGGVFVTQQVGERNMAAVKAAFELAPNNVAPVRPETFGTAGFAIERYDEYDVRYTVHDIESLVFWLQALDIAHSDFVGFDATRDVDAINTLLETSRTPEGVETNAHRYLLVARKLP